MDEIIIFAILSQDDLVKRLIQSTLFPCFGVKFSLLQLKSIVLCIWIVSIKNLKRFLCTYDAFCTLRIIKLVLALYAKVSLGYYKCREASSTTCGTTMGVSVDQQGIN